MFIYDCGNWNEIIWSNALQWNGIHVFSLWKQMQNKLRINFYRISSARQMEVEKKNRMKIEL